VSDQTGTDVLDDGNLAGLVTKLGTALTAFLLASGAGATTGDVKLTLKTVADTGWVMMDDGTIGNAASSATTRANADTVNLFTLLWNNVSDTYAPVSGGRGGSAAADFAANKRIGLTKVLGRALAISGTGSGLTARTLGQTVGEETHTPTIGETAAHTHTAPGAVKPDTVGSGPFFVESTADGGVSTPTLSAGSGTAFNVMQPTSFLNVMVKL
jgi:hypothetical protein